MNFILYFIVIALLAVCVTCSYCMSFISPCLQPNGKHSQSGLGLCLHLGEGLQQVGLGAVEIKNLIICSKLGHHSLISAGLFFESALSNISIVAFDSKFFLLKTSCRLFLIKMSLSLSQIWLLTFSTQCTGEGYLLLSAKWKLPAYEIRNGCQRNGQY